MNWWIIAALVVFVIIIFKYKEIRHKIGLMAVILMLLFLVASFGQIYATHDLDLTSFDGLVDAGKIYFSWLGAAARNIVHLGGYAIKQDWSVDVKTIGNDLESAGNAVSDVANKTKK